MNSLFIVTYKARRVAIHHAETKWEAIDIAYNDSICRGFNAQREHFDAFKKHKKPKRKIRQLKMF